MASRPPIIASALSGFSTTPGNSTARHWAGFAGMVSSTAWQPGSGTLDAGRGLTMRPTVAEELRCELVAKDRQDAHNVGVAPSLAILC